MSEFALRGVMEQTLIVSAVRYAMGSSTYMPSLTCRTIAEKIDALEPSTAATVARDIRNWWTECEGPSSPEKYRTSSTYYQIDVLPFLELLPKLDKRSEPLMGEYPFIPYLPNGSYRWSDVPEEIRFKGNEEETGNEG